MVYYAKQNFGLLWSVGAEISFYSTRIQAELGEREREIINPCETLEKYTF